MSVADVSTGRVSAPGLNLALIAGIVAAGQFASLVFAPAIPATAAALGVTPAIILSTATAFMAATALAQLLAGPISDRFGRRLPILVGVVAYIIGGGMAAAANDVRMLMIGRIVQAAGAGLMLVSARAATRDAFAGVALQKAMATITIAFSLAPAFAPLIGGIAATLGGHRAPFEVTVAFGLILAAFAFAAMPETRAPADRAPLSGAFAAYGRVLALPSFRRNAWLAGLANGGMTAFFTGAPVLMIAKLGVTPAEFGLYPPLAVIGFVIGGIVVRRSAGRLAPTLLIGVGTAIMTAGALALVAPALAGAPTVLAINAAMVVFVTGLGVLAPTATALALDGAGADAASAAALLGVSQMAMGALAAAAVAALQPVLPLAAFQIVMLAACALLAVAMIRRTTTAPSRG